MINPSEIRPNTVLIYNDGRPGHTAARAIVCDYDRNGMDVQFEDRADTTRISFSDRAWMDHLSIDQPDNLSDPRQCERCGETITGGIHCFGKYLFLCGGCAAKLEREATPLKLPQLRLPPIRVYKFNPHIEVL